MNADVTDIMKTPAAQLVFKMLGITDASVIELQGWPKVLAQLAGQENSVRVYQVAGKVKGQCMTLLVIADR